MNKPKTYSSEVRERAVRMVFEHAPSTPAVGLHPVHRREDRLLR